MVIIMIKEMITIYWNKISEKLKSGCKYIPYLFPIVLYSVLVLSNLNNRVMYADESLTAMLGKNILSYGFPKVWDGSNLAMASINGNEFNESLIYIRDNWLSYYIAALGQLIAQLLGCDVFGSVYCMRFLFASISILGIICFYFLVKEITKNTTITFLSLLLYSTSVPALLHFRSIYYVALIPTFIITTMLFYLKTVNTKSWEFCTLFILSATLLFHSLFLHFFIAMFSIGVVYFLFDIKKENLKYFIVSLTVIGLFTIPWWIYQRAFLSKVETGLFSKNSYFFEAVLGYLWQIHAYYFPFVTLGLISLIFVFMNRIKRKKSHRYLNKKCINTYSILGKEKTFEINNHIKNKSSYKTILIIGCPIFFNILLVSLFSSFLETRWLLASVPFLFILNAYLVAYMISQVRFVGLVVLVMIIFTNGLHIAPYLLVKQLRLNPNAIETIIKPPVPFYNANASGWLNKKADLAEYLEKMCYVQSYLLDFIEEISNEFYDADKGMVIVLDKYANKDQRVYLVGFQFETIAYYNNMKVVNRLDPTANPLPTFYQFYPNATTFYQLTEYPILQCDWIIERSAGISNAIWHDDDLFEKIYIDFPESEPWNEIWAHTFYTDRTYSGFYIYRNKRTTKATDLKGIFSLTNVQVK